MTIKVVLFRMRHVLTMLSVLLIAPVAQAATTPSLGAAASYAVLANTYTNPAGGTTVNGDVGFTVAPASVPTGVHANYGSGSPYATAGADQATALAALNAQPCTFTWGAAVELGSDATHGTAGVFTPGVYCAGGAMSITTPITLNGSGTYIFRSVGAFTSAASVSVTLAGGASANNVFWTPTGATTFGASASIAGTIIGTAPITFGASTILNGRALAYASVVTNGDADVITAPTPAPGVLHVITQVVNDSGGTSTAGFFIAHVKLLGVDVASSPAAGVGAPGTSYSLPSGTYVVSENALAGYSVTFSGDCDSSGIVTLGAGADKTCTITNDDIPGIPPATEGTINVSRVIVNDNGGTKTAADFSLFVNGLPVLSGSTNVFSAPSMTTGTVYTVSGTTDARYTLVFSGDCDAGGHVSLRAGNNKFCIILYNDIDPAASLVPFPFPTPVVDTSLLQNLQNMGIAVHSLVKLPDDGNASTQEDSAVYYIGADGKRHSFPNSRIYFTWFTDFSGVRVVSAQQLASIPLSLNVRYKPGRRMIKFITDPKVYAVSRGGVLRWVKTEGVATALYGSLWNKSVDDLSDAFYTNYTFGTDVNDASDFNINAQELSVGNISADYGL